MLDLIIEYCSMWAPALVSVFAIAAMVITGLGRITDAVDKVKDSKTFKELKEQLEAERAENKDLHDQLKLLTDKYKAFDDKANAIISAQTQITNYERLDLEELKTLCARLNLLFSENLKCKCIEEETNESDNTETQKEVSDC